MGRFGDSLEIYFREILGDNNFPSIIFLQFFYDCAKGIFFKFKEM